MANCRGLAVCVLRNGKPRRIKLIRLSEYAGDSFTPDARKPEELGQFRSPLIWFERVVAHAMDWEVGDVLFPLARWFDGRALGKRF